MQMVHRPAYNAIGKAMNKLLAYVINLLACLSQFVNVLLFNGHPNETLSARCGRVVKMNKTTNPLWLLLAAFIDLVFLPFEEDHCFESYITERMWARQYLEDTE